MYPERGTRANPEPLMIGSLPPRQGATKLRPYTFIFRLSVLAALVLTSAFMAGWKWGNK
jgi:hypothetical protein